MSQCPYPEMIISDLNGEPELNPAYLAWHQGFETHKLEMMAKFKCSEVYLHELLNEARMISQLKREMKTKSSLPAQKDPVA
jgi:hypothetical protein